MSIDKEPLSPILVRFQQDLQLNRRGERTQQSYVRNVRKFAEFLQREPDSASEDDLRNYLLFIKNDRHWSSSTINVAQQALKKFFTLTCPREWPKNWIFPSEGKNHLLAPTAEEPMSESSVQGVIKAVLKQLNWDQRGISTHTLRHCYATHLLEAGVSIKSIQKYLGHAHLTTTMIYLHVTTVGEENAIAKINAVMKRKS